MATDHAGQKLANLMPTAFSVRCFFPVDTVDKAEREKCVVGFVHRVGGCIRVWRAGHVSVGRFRADAALPKPRGGI